jgi:hypothetical protein
MVPGTRERQTNRLRMPYDCGKVGLGDKEQALTWLERAYDEQDPWLFWLKTWPPLDPLRSEPRFQALLCRVTFPQ